jgi:tyrosine-protein kinase
VTTTDPHAGDIREYLAILKARKLTIVLVVALLVGATMLLTLKQARIYEGEARVLVKPVQTAATATSVPQAPNLDTEREVVLSQTLADQVRTTLKLSTPAKDLLRNLRVQVVTDTEVLVVRYDDPVPATAARLANAFADTYVSFRTKQAEDSFRAATESVRAQMSRLQDQVSAYTRKINATKDPGVRDSFQTRRDGLIVQLGVLSQRLFDLQASSSATQTSAGEILQRAEVPQSPVSPNPIRSGMLAGFVGVILGVGFAFLREHLDDRVTSPHEVERRLGTPVLAAVPRVAGWRRSDETQLVMRSDPKSPVSESYRTLGTNVLYMASQQPMNVLMVTSAIGGDGKTTTAANLAVVLAQSGKRAILLSADLRRPRIHQFFDLPNGLGLSDALTGANSLGEIAIDPGTENLRIVNAGMTPNDPAALLGGQRTGKFLASLREVAEFVIVDTPPVLAVADASIIAPLVDGTIFVLDAGRSSRSAMVQARDQLEKAGARIIGAVYNNFDPSADNRYPYYYDYYQYTRSNGAKAATNGNGSKLRLRKGVK